MRMYQQLWYLIRDSNGATVTISCAPHLRRRIRKAIYKEKDIDPRVDKRRHIETHLTSTGVTFRLRGVMLNSSTELQHSSAIREINYESFAGKIKAARASLRHSSGEPAGANSARTGASGSTSSADQFVDGS